MNDRTKAISSTIVIVACIAVLGALAYTKVDGAATAAFGTIAIVVAWLTRSPDNPNPPPAAKMVPFFAAGVVLAELLGCSPAPLALPKPTPEQLHVAARGKELEQLLACVDDNDAGARIDACAGGVRARWLDGGAK